METPQARRMVRNFVNIQDQRQLVLVLWIEWLDWWLVAGGMMGDLEMMGGGLMIDEMAGVRTVLKIVHSGIR